MRLKITISDSIKASLLAISFLGCKGNQFN